MVEQFVSYNRDPRFASSQRHILFTFNRIEMRKLKEKVAGNGQMFEDNLSTVNIVKNSLSLKCNLEDENEAKKCIFVNIKFY